MTDIKLYNTRTRKKEAFAPIDPDNVRMYVCGPTVYDRAHIGNARPVVVFDTLYRLLRQVYGAEHVTYVRNFTDVDDKINATALARKEAGAKGSLEELVHERSEETIRWYLEDMGKLGALEPSIKGSDNHEKAMPRATQFIPQMVKMIEDLIARGHAYAKEGHVLFRVRSYKGYGGLSGRSVDDMIAGARVEVAPFKEDPMDFVLWKPSSDDLPGWGSPWGRGRPGWHIECSAMAYELLGESFDIHGGGNDLMFPHHENEIAQSCCAHPKGEFARVWMHNEMLQVEGKKMSKSLGNFFTVHDLLEQDVPGEVIRFVFLSTHYRKPMDWTEKKREEAHSFLAQVNTLMRKGLSNPLGEDEKKLLVDQEMVDALANDLNTHLALQILRRRLFVEAKTSSVDSLEMKKFAANLAFLGFNGGDPEQQGRRVAVEKALSQVTLDEFSVTLSEERKKAFESKDFTEVDRLKAALTDAGVEVRMSKDGVELLPGAGFDPAKLEALK